LSHAQIARGLFFYQADQKIIFSHGFVKKTQKTPLLGIQRTMAIRKADQGNSRGSGVVIPGKEFQRGSPDDEKELKNRT
jgi:hypothetical protein